jgi:hypothetical protein
MDLQFKLLTTMPHTPGPELQLPLAQSQSVALASSQLLELHPQPHQLQRLQLQERITQIEVEQLAELHLPVLH